MRDEDEVVSISEHLPLQAPPATRTLIGSGASGEAGVEACDNDHNFFVYGSC